MEGPQGNLSLRIVTPLMLSSSLRPSWVIQACGFTWTEVEAAWGTGSAIHPRQLIPSCGSPCAPGDEGGVVLTIRGQREKSIAFEYPSLLLEA